MKNRLARLAISALVFLVYAWLSTIYYTKYIHDVGGTWWWLGVYGLPVVLLIVGLVDFFLSKLRWFRRRMWVLTAIDCLLAVALYYPGFPLGLFVLAFGMNVLGVS